MLFCQELSDLEGRMEGVCGELVEVTGEGVRVRMVLEGREERVEQQEQELRELRETLDDKDTQLKKIEEVHCIYKS